MQVIVECHEYYTKVLSSLIPLSIFFSYQYRPLKRRSQNSLPSYSLLSCPCHIVTSRPGTLLTEVPFYIRPSDSQSALVQVAEADIHAVAGLLKLYLRDLPEPLFTDDLYLKFVEANGRPVCFGFVFLVINVSSKNSNQKVTVGWKRVVVCQGLNVNLETMEVTDTHECSLQGFFLHGLYEDNRIVTSNDSLVT